MNNDNQKPQPIPQYPPVYYYPDDEITLKELILKFLEYIREFQRNLPLIALLTAATIALATAYQQYKGYEYQTTLSYKLENTSFLSWYNNIAPLGLKLNLTIDEITNKASEDDFLNNFLQRSTPNNQPISQLLTKSYPNIIDENPNQTQYNLRKLLLHQEDKKNLGLIDLTNEQLTVTTNSETLSPIIMTEFITALNSTLQTEVDSSFPKSLQYFNLLEQQLQSKLDTQNEVIQNLSSGIARDEAYGLLLNTLQELRSVESKKQQLDLLKSFPAPSVKVTRRSVTPKIIGTSLLKTIIISGILGLFFALGYIAFRKIIRDAMA